VKVVQPRDRSTARANRNRGSRCVELEGNTKRARELGCLELIYPTFGPDDLKAVMRLSPRLGLRVAGIAFRPDPQIGHEVFVIRLRMRTTSHDVAFSSCHNERRDSRQYRAYALHATSLRCNRMMSCMAVVSKELKD
jgi:hypothetical protein